MEDNQQVSKVGSSIPNKRQITKDYSLNIQRALMNKLEATKREAHLEFKNTGGGLVITADAATFELIRQATAIYYSRMTQENILIQEEKDKSGNIIVEAQIHTKNDDILSNICQQSDNSVEKQLGKKTTSCKILRKPQLVLEVQRVMFKYNLGRAIDMLNNADVTKTTVNQIKGKLLTTGSTKYQLLPTCIKG
ncbi:unnamed protein product [Mytilus edulis]|uniref:Uncharacterized protein n=1 Tax=Mytilus edulis TaxID=6550 RepID=A0A8S3QML0_MYTED|nr:unnamed protein product [Mytilus edulis]